VLEFKVKGQISNKMTLPGGTRLWTSVDGNVLFIRSYDFTGRGDGNNYIWEQ
jgi:hypothetical protein